MRTLNPAKAKAGHIGGTATLERYGRGHMATIGRLGGRPPLPTIEELLRVEAAAREDQIRILGGERLPNRLRDLKRLWKIEQNKRERLLLEAASPREV